MEPEIALAPLLHFDGTEPFLPELAAVTVFTKDAPSPSFPATVEVKGDVAVEYALWWPCEIGHVYELEHVWVHGVQSGSGWQVTAVEGSAHGGRHSVAGEQKAGRPVVYLEPGKHGTASHPDNFILPRDVSDWLCGSGAGRAGVCVTDLFADRLFPTPVHHRQARRFLQQYAFAPTWRFDNVVDAAELAFWTFEEFAPTVPKRVFSQLEKVSSAPLLRSAGGLFDDTAVAVVEAYAGKDGVEADGLAFGAVLDAVRSGQRELVVILGELDPRSIEDLVASLRQHWCVTATSLVCQNDAQYKSARSAGAIAIADCRKTPPKPGDDWVLTADDVTAAFRVVGPGGDVDYRF